MKIQWKSMVMIAAALALSMGIAAPAWSLGDPMQETYTAHVIPFYKIDSNWSAFLVVADTSFRDLDEDGSPIYMTFYKAKCNFVSDAIVEVTRTDAQYFELHSDYDAAGQFNGIPDEGVVLLDGRGNRFLTYVLLVNGNDNSLIRIDSIPCQGPEGGPCFRSEGQGPGRWLRYNTFNTVAATFGDSGLFHTNLYFFSAVDDDDGEGDLRRELLRYGTPLHGEWAQRIHVDAWCDEIYLGSRKVDLKCTQRLRLQDLNYTFLNEFPNEFCHGRPGHIETYASDNGIDVVSKDYSGFQETLAELVPGVRLIGTGYMHHSE